MNKAQLIDALATKFDGNRRTASEALEAVLDTVTRTVVTGEKVGITGFGVFEKLEKPARTVRNPATGASVKKKKTSVPRFRPGAELKAYVSGEKKFARVPAAKKTAVAAVTAAAPAPAPAPVKRATKTAAVAPTPTPAAAPAKRATKTAAAKTTAAAPAKAAPAKRATKTAEPAPAKATAAKTATKATASKTAAAAPAKAAPAKRAARKS